MEYKIFASSHELVAIRQFTCPPVLGMPGMIGRGACFVNE